MRQHIELTEADSMLDIEFCWIDGADLNAPPAVVARYSRDLSGALPGYVTLNVEGAGAAELSLTPGVSAGLEAALRLAATLRHPQPRATPGAAPGANMHPQNVERAAWASTALHAFTEECGNVPDLESQEGREEMAADLIADLLHLIEQGGGDPKDLMRRAVSLFDHESAPGYQGD